MPLPASYYQTLDTRQQQGVNADEGGTWNPSSPLRITGDAGLWCAGPWTTCPGFGIDTLPGSGKRVVLAANDVPLFAPGHDLSTQAISTQCAHGAIVSASGTPAPPTFPIWTPLTSYAAGATVTVGQLPYFYTSSGGVSGSSANFGTPLQPLASVTDGSITWTRGDPVSGGYLYLPGVGGRFVLPLDVHNGATFTIAQLIFRAATHTSLPATLPSMRVYAVDAFGDVFPLGGLPNTPGFLSLPTPPSVSAYSDQVLELIYEINPGVVINRFLFSYFAEIVDESGAGAVPGNRYQRVSGAFFNIAGMFFP